MKMTLEKDDWKWFKLRRRLFEDNRCERRQKSKASIFAALAGRWRDRGISGSSSDWWTHYPNELFDDDFYAALVQFRRERGEGSFQLDEAFRSILRLAPPQGFLRNFWLPHGGGHKIYLLRALLGPEEYDRQADPNQWVLLVRTDWVPSDYLGGSVLEEGKSPFDDMDLDDDADEEEETEGYHVADYWDGQIINCEGFEDFDKTWRKLEILIERFESFHLAFDFEEDEEFPELFHQVESLLEKCLSSDNALMELAEFEESDPVVTEGPMSGSGVRLYHADSAIVEELTLKCSDVLELAKEAPDEPEGEEE